MLTAIGIYLLMAWIVYISIDFNDGAKNYKEEEIATAVFWPLYFLFAFCYGFVRAIVGLLVLFRSWIDAMRSIK